MNYTHYKRKLVNWLTTIVEFQLFITLISLPTLIAWGLPLSLLSLLGNTLFTPLLAAILLLCSLLFFCELFYISSSFLAQLLGYIVRLWSTLMTSGSASMLVAYKKPPVFILFIFFICIVVMIHYSIRKSRLQRIINYVTFLIVFSLINKGLSLTHSIEYVPHHNRSIALITTKSHSCLIDPAATAQRGNVSAFVEYTLTQTILQKTGRLHLDYVVVAKPSTQTFKALKKLLSKLSVSYLCMPHLKGNFSYQFSKELEELKEYAQQRECTIIFCQDEYECPLGANNTLSVTTMPYYNKIDKGYYKAVKVTGQIDNTSFTFYSP